MGKILGFEIFDLYLFVINILRPDLYFIWL